MFRAGILFRACLCTRVFQSLGRGIFCVILRSHTIHPRAAVLAGESLDPALLERCAIQVMYVESSAGSAEERGAMRMGPVLYVCIPPSQAGRKNLTIGVIFRTLACPTHTSGLIFSFFPDQRQTDKKQTLPGITAGGEGYNM